MPLKFLWCWKGIRSLSGLVLPSNNRRLRTPGRYGLLFAHFAPQQFRPADVGLGSNSESAPFGLMSASAGCGHSVARAYGYSRPFLSWGCCCWTAGREVSAIRGLSGVSCSVANRIQTRAISIRRRPESSLLTVRTSRKHSRASRRYSSARLFKKRRPLPNTPSLQAGTLRCKNRSSVEFQTLLASS